MSGSCSPTVSGNPTAPASSTSPTTCRFCTGTRSDPLKATFQSLFLPRMIHSLLLTTIVFCGTDAVEMAREFRRVHGPEIIEDSSVLQSTPNVADDGPNRRRNAEHRFEDRLGAPTIIVPIANHENTHHEPDEDPRIANPWYAMDLGAAILTLGQDGR